MATWTAEKIFQIYFDGDPWVGRETPMSSIDDRVTAAVLGQEYHAPGPPAAPAGTNRLPATGGEVPVTLGAAAAGAAMAVRHLGRRGTMQGAVSQEEAQQ